MNALDVVAGEEKKIQEVTQIQEIHMWRFNIIAKSLFIILDNNITQLAIFNSSRPRGICNDQAHPFNVVDETFLDTIRRLPEISKAMSKPMDELEAEEYKRDVYRLTQMIYHGDDYFTNVHTDLEIAMDAHVKSWVK